MCLIFIIDYNESIWLFYLGFRLEYLKLGPNLASSAQDEMKMLSIMPEPVGIFSLPKEAHSKYKEVAESIFDSAPMDTRRTDDSNLDLEHICNRRHQNVFRNFPELKGLEKKIRDFSIQYIKQIGYLCDEVVITDAWLNRAKEHSSLHPHIHMNSYLSGTYYINFEPKKESEIVFYNNRISTGLINRPTISIPVNSKFPTAFNSKELHVSCKEGEVLIWNSHLVHGYKNNKLKNRWSLSFNVMPKICTDGEIYSFTVSEGN